MSINPRLRVSVVLMLVLWSGIASAQTWSEWFSQKKTQQKYLLEQLAALKLYASYAKKGYEIGSSGIAFVKGLSKGEFDLHETFFNSLKFVSPAISKQAKVGEIISMQLLIIKTLARVKKEDGIKGANLSYVNSVSENLSSACLKDLEELLLLITSGRVEMSDDERLNRIDKLHESMSDKREFVLQFYLDVQAVANGRFNEQKELKEIGGWYENR